MLRIFAAGMWQTLTVGMRQQMTPIFCALSAIPPSIVFLFGARLFFSAIAFLISLFILHWVIPSYLASDYITKSLKDDLSDISERYVKPNASNFWVATIDGNICGTIAAEPPAENSPWKSSDIELRRMSVSDSFRRLGVATKLIRHLVHHYSAQGYQRIVLSTSNYQEAARHMYAKMGFKVVKMEKIYYGLFNIYYYTKMLNEN